MNSPLFAQPLLVNSLDDCHFYHTTEIPGIGLVEASWDLREGVAAYLGNVDFSGKRVLEIGPASGFLTIYMEQRGAEVVSVELPVGEGYSWDYVPYAGLELDTIQTEQTKMMSKLINSFWFCHERFQSKAKVYNGSAYNLPAELGEFDIAVCAAVLTHMQNPTEVLANCAKLV